MNKKSLLPILVILLSIPFISNTNYVSCVDLTLTDATNDLVHVVDGETVATNVTVQPEIDIVSLVLNDTTIAVTFLAEPILSIDNWYDFIVYWNGQDIQNITDGHWNKGNIISETKLVNSTGDIIVHTTSNSSIEVIGNTIYYPIFNASMIVTDLDPVNMIMDARHRTGPGAEFYRDTLEYNVGTESAPGFTNVISFVGLATIVLIIINKKKKR